MLQRICRMAATGKGTEATASGADPHRGVPPPATPSVQPTPQLHRTSAYAAGVAAAAEEGMAAAAAAAAPASANGAGHSAAFPAITTRLGSWDLSPTDVALAVAADARAAAAASAAAASVVVAAAAEQGTTSAAAAADAAYAAGVAAYAAGVATDFARAAYTAGIAADFAAAEAVQHIKRRFANIGGARGLHSFTLELNLSNSRTRS